ncbi:MAG: hypothetical protein RL757_876 [Bacteroidota bacterium]|jgi:microcystin-dependent protein
MDPFIGQLMLFAGTFAPRGWAFCNGQLLSISQNTALFSLLGTTYGGDGQTTFALPDLRGRVPVGTGAGPGLSPVVQGHFWGTDNVTLNQMNLPAHTHTGTVNSLVLPINDIPDDNDTIEPSRGVLANTGANAYASSPSGTHSYTGNLGTIQIGVSGSNTPFNIHQPSLGMNYCIALQGIYPSRD